MSVRKSGETNESVMSAGNQQSAFFSVINGPTQVNKLANMLASFYGVEPSVFIPQLTAVEKRFKNLNDEIWELTGKNEQHIVENGRLENEYAQLESDYMSIKDSLDLAMDVLMDVRRLLGKMEHVTTITTSDQYDARMALRAIRDLGSL